MFLAAAAPSSITGRACRVLHSYELACTWGHAATTRCISFPVAVAIAAEAAGACASNSTRGSRREQGATPRRNYLEDGAPARWLGTRLANDTVTKRTDREFEPSAGSAGG